MKHLFIVNPMAGKGKTAAVAVPEMERACKARGLDFEIHITSGPGEGETYARKIAERGEPVRIYACGGDGTLYDVVNGAIGHDNVEVASIPLGSGNDFIRLFGSREAFSDIDAQIEGKTVTLDAINCNGKYAINQCSMGFDANVCDKQATFKKLPWLKGESAYVASLLYCFIKKMENTFTISIDDGEPETMKVLFAYVGNSRWYGGGFMAAPLAMPNDGLLDFVIVKKDISKLQMLSLIAPYKNGKHLSWERTLFKRGKKIHITSEETAVVNVDGEIQYVKESTMEIVEKAVRFVIPTTSTFFEDVASGKISDRTPLNP